MNKVKAGFSYRDISPEKPLPGRLGLNHTIHPFHPICAKAVALRADDRVYLMIVCEIVGLTKSEIAEIRERIENRTNIPIENIIITGTHTHASPWVWDLQDTQARKHGFAPLDREWMSKVIEMTAKAGIEATMEMELYEIRFGIAGSEGIVSNRVEPVTRWSICPDDELRNAPVGVVDSYVRTISFHDDEGLPVFIFSNLHVHPTAFGGGKTTRVSPDFPYIAEQELKKKYGKNTIVAYWQGCAGNSNSGKYVKEGSLDEVTAIGKRLGDAVKRAVESSSAIQADFEFRQVKFRLPVGDFVLPPEDAEAAFVKKCDEIKSGRDDDETIFHWRKKLKQLDVSLLGYDKGMEIEFQLFRFGDTDIMFVPGEWYVQMYTNLAEQYPKRNLIVTTLNNFDLLYVPDEASMPQTDWYGVRTGMRSLGNDSAVRLYNEAVDFLG